MKAVILIITLLLALLQTSTAAGEKHELSISEIGIRLEVLSIGGEDRVRFSITNSTANEGVFRLPSPYVVHKNSRDSFAPYPPYLALVVKDKKSGVEKEFVFTSSRKLKGPGKVVRLGRGKGIDLDYSLRTFFLWGPEAPVSDSFKNTFRPGTAELEARVEIFTVHPDGPRKVVSNPQTLLSVFPDWIFKGDFASDLEQKSSPPKGPSSR